MATARGLESFQTYKEISGPGIGLVSILRNDRGEFLLRKTLDKAIHRHHGLINARTKRLLLPSFQQVVFTSPQEDEIYFEFSKRSLDDHFSACLSKDMIVSEEDLWSLLKSLAESGQLLERLGEYHPSLTLQNVFRLSDRFKVLSPYVFDSYINEVAMAERQRTKISFAGKIKVNLIQSACIVLCMGILVSERDLKVAQKEGKIAKLLLQFQERYSARFSNLIEDIIYRRIEAFADLLNKLEGTPKIRDSVNTEIAISPPIDFDSDVFSTMPDEKHLARNKDKHAMVSDDRVIVSKRFLGADGVAKVPTRKSEAYPLKAVSGAKPEAIVAEEEDYKLTENKSGFDYRDPLARTKEPVSKVEFQRRLEFPKSEARYIDRLRYDSITSTPIASNSTKMVSSKSYKELIQQTTAPYNGVAVRNSDTNHRRYDDDEYKASSDTNFFCRKSNDGLGTGLGSEDRVTSIINRLNKRFKQYHVDEAGQAEAYERPRQAHDLLKSPRTEIRAKEEALNTFRKTWAADDGLYSPFDLSNTKKQIDEERGNQFGFYRGTHQLRNTATSSGLTTGDRQRLTYTDHRDSPRTIRLGEGYSVKGKPTEAYRVKQLDEPDVRHAKQHITHGSRLPIEANDGSVTAKKKNRSVSFNLCNNSFDLSRSFASKTKGPKSILKKPGTEDPSLSAEKQKKQMWKHEADMMYNKYSHSYQSQARDVHDGRDDFRIETKFMGSIERPTTSYYDQPVDKFKPRGPAFTDYGYRRDRNVINN